MVSTMTAFLGYGHNNDRSPALDDGVFSGLAALAVVAVSDNEKRRDTDSGIGRLALHYPMYAGAVLVLLSLGGYIATIKYMGGHQDVQDNQIHAIQKEDQDRDKLLSRIVALQETMDRRIIMLEDRWDKRGR